MRGFGALLFAVGLLATFLAFGMDTTVYTSPSFIGGEAVGGGSSHNLGLLQKQIMTLHTGLGAAIAGAIFMAADLRREPSSFVSAAPSEQAFLSDEQLEARAEQARQVKRTHGIIALTLSGAFVALYLLS